MNISLAGLIQALFIFFSLVSLLTFVQAGFFDSSQAVANEVKPQREQITDAVVAVAASEEILRAAQFQNIPVLLTNLPVERSWPIRGRVTTSYARSHPAIDVATSRGTPIHPFASGVVIESRYGGSWGRYVIVRHNDGYESAYAHLASSLVTVGQQVTPATVIGTVGTTGRSTGPHLHFQITRNNQTLNPLSVLP